MVNNARQNSGAELKIPYHFLMQPELFRTIQRVSFFSLLIAATALFFWMLRDFTFTFLWALILAVVLYPLSQRLGAFVRNQTLGSALTILSLFLIVIVPISAIATSVADDAVRLYQEITANGDTYVASVLAQPLVRESLTLANMSEKDAVAWITDTAQTLSSWAVKESVALGSKTFTATIHFLIMVYLLFSLLRDGERLGVYLLRALPLGNEREMVLYRRFASTTRAIVKGTFVVALVQGLIGGILFFFVGIPNAIFWGTLMAFAALIPAVGPGLVWLPAALILASGGHIVESLVVLFVGGIVISLVDNILRPILVGRDTAMPDALILLSIIGGIASFGLTGVVLGPVIAALFLSIWDLFEAEYSLELAEQG